MYLLLYDFIFRVVGWSSSNAFVCGSVGLRFKSRADQIVHSVANGSPPQENSFDFDLTIDRNGIFRSSVPNFSSSSVKLQKLVFTASLLDV